MDAIEIFLDFGIPLLVSLLGAAVVTFATIWFAWRRRPAIGRSLALIVLLALGTFVVAKSISPSGKYAVGGCRGPGFQALGISDMYRELSGGVLYDVVDGERYRVGSYSKENGIWMIRLSGGGPRGDAPQQLRFSVLGFYTILPAFEAQEAAPTQFNRRRIIPFRRPEWLPEWLE